MSVISGVERGYAKRPGSLIGPYLVKRLLGQGCEGHVYLVADTRCGSLRTLKLLRGRSMVSEAEHIAAHYKRLRPFPSVKRFVEWGILTGQSGVGLRPWLAFDYVEGATLYELAKKGRIGCPICILIQVAQAVEPLHQQRIALGDFDKGRNVLIEKGTGRVVFCDLDAGEIGRQPLPLSSDLEELALLAGQLLRAGGAGDDRAVLAHAISKARSMQLAASRLQKWNASGGCRRCKPCQSRPFAKSAEQWQRD